MSEALSENQFFCKIRIIYELWITELSKWGKTEEKYFVCFGLYTFEQTAKCDPPHKSFPPPR